MRAATCGSSAVDGHAALQTILPGCDVVVGTEEEIHIAGGTTDTTAALRKIRSITPALIVVKRGPIGAQLFPSHSRHPRAWRRRSWLCRRGVQRARRRRWFHGRVPARTSKGRTVNDGTCLGQRLRRAGCLAARLRPGHSNLDGVEALSEGRYQNSRAAVRYKLNHLPLGDDPAPRTSRSLRHCLRSSRTTRAFDGQTRAATAAHRRVQTAHLSGGAHGGGERHRFRDHCR